MRPTSSEAPAPTPSASAVSGSTPGPPTARSWLSADSPAASRCLARLLRLARLLLSSAAAHAGSHPQHAGHPRSRSTFSTTARAHRLAGDIRRSAPGRPTPRLSLGVSRGREHRGSLCAAGPHGDAALRMERRCEPRWHTGQRAGAPSISVSPGRCVLLYDASARGAQRHLALLRFH